MAYNYFMGRPIEAMVADKHKAYMSKFSHPVFSNDYEKTERISNRTTETNIVPNITVNITFNGKPTEEEKNEIIQQVKKEILSLK